MATYDQILYINHVVPTFYPTAAGAVAPASGAPEITLSNPDLQARAQRVLNAMYWTVDQLQTQSVAGATDAKTLKVYMVPEFYFRTSSAQEQAQKRYVGPNSPGFTAWGSYDVELRYELLSRLYEIISQTDKFKDWSMVLGTVCTVLDRTEIDDLRLFNSALVMRGARAQDDGSRSFLLMEKQAISNLDGAPYAAHANLDPFSIYAPTYNPDPMLDNLIAWDGMILGVEVCLDHGEGELRDMMYELQQALGPATPTVGLHLVTSCAMSLNASNVVVPTGRVALLCDGDSRVWPPDTTSASPRAQAAHITNEGTPATRALDPFPAPTFTAFPDTADYRVFYPTYGGDQGIRVYAQQPLDASN